MNRITETEQLLTTLFGTIAALPSKPPKAHQGNREKDRRLKQRYHLAAKQALRGDKRIQLVRI